MNYFLSGLLLAAALFQVTIFTADYKNGNHANLFLLIRTKTLGKEKPVVTHYIPRGRSHAVVNDINTFFASRNEEWRTEATLFEENAQGQRYLQSTKIPSDAINKLTSVLGKRKFGEE
jgi:hypothetical protein